MDQPTALHAYSVIITDWLGNELLRLDKVARYRQPEDARVAAREYGYEPKDVWEGPAGDHMVLV